MAPEALGLQRALEPVVSPTSFRDGLVTAGDPRLVAPLRHGLDPTLTGLVEALPEAASPVLREPGPELPLAVRRDAPVRTGVARAAARVQRMVAALAPVTLSGSPRAPASPPGVREDSGPSVLPEVSTSVPATAPPRVGAGPTPTRDDVVPRPLPGVSRAVQRSGPEQGPAPVGTASPPLVVRPPSSAARPSSERLTGVQRSADAPALPVGPTVAGGGGGGPVEDAPSPGPVAGRAAARPTQGPAGALDGPAEHVPPLAPSFVPSVAPPTSRSGTAVDREHPGRPALPVLGLDFELAPVQRTARPVPPGAASPPRLAEVVASTSSPGQEDAGPGPGPGTALVRSARQASGQGAVEPSGAGAPAAGQALPVVLRTTQGSRPLLGDQDRPQSRSAEAGVTPPYGTASRPEPPVGPVARSLVTPVDPASAQPPGSSPSAPGTDPPRAGFPAPAGTPDPRPALQRSLAGPRAAAPVMAGAPPASPAPALRLRRPSAPAAGVATPASSWSPGATAFAEMFSAPASTPTHHRPGSTPPAGPTASEPPLQREVDEDPTASSSAPTVEVGDGTPEPPATAPTTAAPASVGASAPAAPQSPVPSGSAMEEMAALLYEPLSARLRAELWADRERVGL